MVVMAPSGSVTANEPSPRVTTAPSGSVTVLPGASVVAASDDVPPALFPPALPPPPTPRFSD
jgi:hypothetical protein